MCSTNGISFAYLCIVSMHAIGTACFYLVGNEKAGQEGALSSLINTRHLNGTIVMALNISAQQV